jgi:hypothetical protein
VNPFKIIGWVGIAIAVLGAFMEVPYAGAILVVLGLVVGVSVAAEDHVRVLVSALVLAALSGVLGNIPGVGMYLAAISSAVGTFAAGAALTIISCNVWKRFKP